jgi:RNase P protein component
VETRVSAPGLAQVVPDLVQTVIPKRLLKKAVDRNGLRRIIREAVRSRREAWGQALLATSRVCPTPRVVLTTSKSFAQLPSRRELKLQWREELNRLLNLLETKLRSGP